MIDLYVNPKYYHIAFSYRDIPKEVDVFEECMRKFAKTPVKWMLELCCGPAPHMVELAKWGYQYAGLDINPKMVEYAENRAEELDSCLCGNDKLSGGNDTRRKEIPA